MLVVKLGVDEKGLTGTVPQKSKIFLFSGDSVTAKSPEQKKITGQSISISNIDHL